MDTLLVAAILPVIGLCSFVYKKDTNSEPMDLLLKLLGYGALIVIPVIAAELFLDGISNTDKDPLLISIFIKTFIGVALAEEGFKWLVVKLKAYNNQEFDEIYDIIVYSVFVSLGFACVENILYVFSGGMGVAILRALLSVPGHACFAVFMGYYLSRAKVASISNNNSLYIKNIVLSLLMPMLFHTMYDALLTWYVNTNKSSIVLLFLLFDVVMVVVGFITVNNTSKVQQNLNENLEAGSIVHDNGQIKLVETKAITPNINFCPLCGTNVQNANYCPKCGFKVR